MQLVANDGTGAPTLSDMWASLGIANGEVLTRFIAAPPNGSSISVRVVDEVSGAVFEQKIAADLPWRAPPVKLTQLLNGPRWLKGEGGPGAAYHLLPARPVLGVGCTGFDRFAGFGPTRAHAAGT